MKIYVVGGAVRDELLGLQIADRDHVVVGATPQQMIDAGFRPVGRDFPVFLHPQTREEYALARTERKVAPGYAGFAFHSAPEVTLEQDLARRDLTINAMARGETGELIDPYGGQADLRARVLRHVGPAFVEDPVRILRLARFAARFQEFTVAPETMTLMRDMVRSGEVDALVAERVWQEIARGLMERRPSRMFALLQDCGALARVMPELAPMSDAALIAVDAQAEAGAPLSVRFAVLARQMPMSGTDPHTERTQAVAARAAQIHALAQRIRVPSELRDLALLACAEDAAVVMAHASPPGELVALLERCDAFRKPRRFGELLAALPEAGPQSRARLQRALDAALAVDAGAIARQQQAAAGKGGQAAGDRIKRAVHDARVAAVNAALAPT